MDAETLRSLVTYDPETGLFHWIDKARKRRTRTESMGYVGQVGYVFIDIAKKSYCAHRLAWLYVHGVWPKIEIDHINGNKTDNRIINLREATKQLNGANRGANRNNTSGSKGVVWDIDREKWAARIKVNGKGIFLGRFETREEAHAAYLVAATAYFGEFANGGKTTIVRSIQGVLT